MAEDEEKFNKETEKNDFKEEDNEEELVKENKEEDIEESGIFDEDLRLSEDGSVSDFSIGDTILSSAPSVHGRQGHNLEELANRKRAEDSKWDDSSEFDRGESSGKDFYDGSGKDFYGEGQNGDALYQGESNNGDLRNNNGNSNLYLEENNKGGVYDAEKSHVKSYGEFADNRRSGRSMLEVAGFEDKEKQKSRDMRGFVKHEGETD